LPQGSRTTNRHVTVQKTPPPKPERKEFNTSWSLYGKISEQRCAKIKDCSGASQSLAPV
jgi:hypothetical protein